MATELAHPEQPTRCQVLSLRALCGRIRSSWSMTCRFLRRGFGLAICC